MKDKFRVLCIDGGGMRGLYTATLLSTLAYRFDSKFSKKSPDIGKNFNLICGTSTGAILACALASGIDLNKIRTLYADYGKLIFPKPMPKEKKKLYLWSFFHRDKPAANADKLREILTEIFGRMTIKQLYEERNIALCVPCINASTHKSWVFKTPHNPDKHRDDNYSLVDVCMSSAAAPILFPISQFNNPDDSTRKDSFVDGGLWANNPIMVGLLEALSLVDKDNHQLEILSVGTCDRPTGDPYGLEDPNWGLMKWRVGMDIVEMSLSAQSFGYTNMAKFLSHFLNKFGLDNKVVRLEQTNKSPQQYSAINIDRSDSLAIKTLNDLAATDADAIHSQVMGQNPGDLILVKDIFTNLLEINDN